MSGDRWPWAYMRSGKIGDSMSVPTRGETYSQLMEYIRKAQEASAMLSHLAAANDDRVEANGWLVVSENFRKMQHSITQLATKGMQ